VGAQATVTERGVLRSSAERRHSTWSKGSRAQGDDGAALVEFALVMPLLFLLLFGIVEFGINMNDYQALRQGVRDATRQAVVGDYGTGSCAPASSSASDNTTAVQCTAVKASSLNSLVVRVVFTDNNTGDPNNFTADKVKVCAITKAKSVTGILAPFLRSVYLKSSVEMRAEKVLTLSTTGITSPSDPSGASWSWC
jgi:Flp pilus assembly protein TadG